MKLVYIEFDFLPDISYKEVQTFAEKNVERDIRKFIYEKILSIPKPQIKREIRNKIIL